MTQNYFSKIPMHARVKYQESIVNNKPCMYNEAGDAITESTVREQKFSENN